MFKELFENRDQLKAAVTSQRVSIKDIEKMFKKTKRGSHVKLRVKNSKSRSGSGYVTLMDIKGDRLLTTALATSSDNAGDFGIEDVMSFDLFKD